MFKYLWQARFKDGHVIKQPPDDRYSKHVDGAEYNPSAFRDIVEYLDKSPMVMFSLENDREACAVNLEDGEFFINGTVLKLERPLEELVDRQVIYFRTMRIDNKTNRQIVYAYNFGYKGTDPESGKVIEKIITIQ